jgi:probable O-glycosylation ligase (exosortase A-associated)
MWRALVEEKLPLYCVLGYLLFEYGRPQGIYESIDVFPFSAAFLALSAVLAFRETPAVHLRVSTTNWLVLFTLLVVISSLAAYSPSLAFANFYIYLNWVFVYIAFVSILSTERRWVLAMALFLLLSFKMSQHGFRTFAARGFAFADWGLGGPPGWFENSGELGIQMCVFLPLSIAFILAFKQHWGRFVQGIAWLMPATAIVTIVGSSSRGAVLGGFAAIVPLMLRSRYKWRALMAFAVVVVIGYILIPQEFLARFDSAGSDATSVSRLTRWKGGIDMMFDHPLLGVGYFNWPIYYGPKYEPGVRGALLSHNIFVQVGAELGMTGLILFVIMILTCFKYTRVIRRIAQANQGMEYYVRLADGLDGALVGYLVSGFFVTVFFYPYFWVNLAFTVALYNIVRLNTHLTAPQAHSLAMRRPGSYGLLSRSHSGAPNQGTVLGHRPDALAVQNRRTPAVVGPAKKGPGRS